jgi:hypothetical protein
MKMQSYIILSSELKVPDKGSNPDYLNEAIKSTGYDIVHNVNITSSIIRTNESPKEILSKIKVALSGKAGDFLGVFSLNYPFALTEPTRGQTIQERLYSDALEDSYRVVESVN